MHNENNKQKGTILSEDRSIQDVNVTRKETFEERNNKNILEKLAELGGASFTDDDILFQDTKQLVIPREMTYLDVARWMERKIDEEEEITSFSKKFRYRPWDGAYCTYNALRNVFGSVVATQSMGFWGPEPPEMRTINISPTETVQVPWGALQIPILPNTTITLSAVKDKELGLLFAIVVDSPRKYKHHVEGLFRAVAEELATNSLYRGKAIDSQEDAEFVDLSGVDLDKIVYTDETWAQINSNVLAQIRDPKRHRKYGLPTKRAALFHGDYGNGKYAGRVRRCERVREA